MPNCAAAGVTIKLILEAQMPELTRRAAPCGTWSSLKAVFAQFMPTWPPAIRSFPTKIIGDDRSAMVVFVDSPEMFGHELRVIAPIDLRGREIVREVDYWDGRGVRAVHHGCHVRGPDVAYDRRRSAGHPGFPEPIVPAAAVWAGNRDSPYRRQRAGRWLRAAEAGRS